MADIEGKGQQSREDVLNFMQMEALGVKRREKITTSDFIENRNYTSVFHLEDMRKTLGADYKPAEQSQQKISDWQNVYRFIQHDGTTAPGDLRNINEGLGQTHRAKLMMDDQVRTYTGEAESHKRRGQISGNGIKKNDFASERPWKQAAPHCVVRGRVVKGNSSSFVTASGDARADLPKVTPPTKNPMTFAPRKAKDNKFSRSARSTELSQSQQRLVQTPLLAEPRTFLASIQDSSFQTSQGLRISPLTRDAISSSTKKLKDSSGHDMGPSAQAAPIKRLPRKSNHRAPNESPMASSVITERSLGSNSGQKSCSSSTPKSGGAVSLDVLMSLGINFSPEQLRIIDAHSQAESLNDTMSDTSASRCEEDLSVPSTNRPQMGMTMATLTNANAPLVNYESSSSASTTTSPVLAKIIPAAASGQDTSVPSTSIDELNQIFPRKVDTSNTVSSAKPRSSTAQIPALSDPSPMISKPKSNDKSGSAGASTIIQGETLKTSNTGISINRSAVQPSSWTSHTYPDDPSPSDIVVAPSTSRTELLRQQRQMIIGSQVYKNRYSHVAGSLVDKFSALSLTDPVKTSVATSTAKYEAEDSVSPNSAGRSGSVDRSTPKALGLSSAAPLLRPRFIPDKPEPLIAGPPSSVLAPTTVNSSIPNSNAVGHTKRSQAVNTRRSAGLSLPPHLLGKTANSDSGAAARAQYSS